MVLHERPRGPQSTLPRSTLDNKENAPQRKFNNWNYGSSSKATLTTRQRELAKPLQEVKQAPVAPNIPNAHSSNRLYEQGHASCRETQEVNLLKIPTALRSQAQLRLSAVPAKRPNPLVQNIAARQITLPKSYLNPFADNSEHSSKTNTTTTTTTSTITLKKPTRAVKSSTTPTSRDLESNDIPIAAQKCVPYAIIPSDMSRVDRELHKKENSRPTKTANNNDKIGHMNGVNVNENQGIGPAPTAAAIPSRSNAHIAQGRGRSDRYQRVDPAPNAATIPPQPNVHATQERGISDRHQRVVPAPTAAAIPSRSNARIAQERGRSDRYQRVDLAPTAATIPSQSNAHAAQEIGISDRHQRVDPIPAVVVILPQSDVHTAQRSGRSDKRKRVDLTPSAAITPSRPNVQIAQERERSDRHQRVDVTPAAAITPMRSNARVTRERGKFDRYQRVDITPPAAIIPLQSNVHVAQERGKSDKHQRAENARYIPVRDESPRGDYQHNTSLVGEYSADIFAYLRQLETLLHPDIGYMDRPSEGDWVIRQANVDFLVSVCHIFESQSETLHLAVHLFDRILSKGTTLTEKGVLLATTCLLIAWKFEERCTFHVVHALANLIDRHEPGICNSVKTLLAAEMTVLKLLDFRIGWPGPLPFLRRCSRADEADFIARQIAKYILEQILLDPGFLVYKPSLQAAAAMILSRSMLGRPEWTEDLIKYSGYVLKDLEPIVIDMIALLRHPGISATNAHRKYSTKPFLKISPWVTRNIAREEYDI
ncbi:hypothetical protein BGX26_006242 [Mortierella sp. AD094]|nr:hypothetical protein BGX26_006242 [Mortierella sp. AD094]